MPYQMTSPRYMHVRMFVGDTALYLAIKDNEDSACVRDSPNGTIGNFTNGTIGGIIGTNGTIGSRTVPMV